MKTNTRKVLIIGGGFSGMSAAIQLCKQGMEVDLVEIDQGWRSYGAGISIGGPTLRAFEQLGILQQYMAEAFVGEGVDVFSADGNLLQHIPSPPVSGSKMRGDGAVMRPTLARILAEATRAQGARVRLGCTFQSLQQDADGVDVQFTDGQTRRYDLVIGADGLNSSVRRQLYPDAAKPQFSGQGVWRAVLPRSASINRTCLWVGGRTKVGLNPVSESEMYLFVNEQRDANEWIDEQAMAERLRNILAEFPAAELQAAASQITPESAIIYRPLEGLLVEQSWHQGRIVMIGDAVHATTPHLAAGACIGIEDAIVLADELSGEGTLEQALQRFRQRRWTRCAMVVNNSRRLGEIEAQLGSREEHGRIMRESFTALALPA